MIVLSNQHLADECNAALKRWAAERLAADADRKAAATRMGAFFAALCAPFEIPGFTVPEGTRKHTREMMKTALDEACAAVLREAFQRAARRVIATEEAHLRELTAARAARAINIYATAPPPPPATKTTVTRDENGEIVHTETRPIV
jgi:hypothetical protein